MKVRKDFSLVAVLVFAQIAGCAGFRAKNLPEVEQRSLKTSVNSKTKVYNDWKIKTKNSSSVSAEALSKAEQEFKKKFEAALLSTECCVVAASEAEADVVVKAVSHDENSRAAMIPAFITGFSGFIIPSWATAHVHFTATANYVEKADTKFEYDVSDSMTMVQWLPMIFAFPFANPFSSGKDMETNAYNNLILAMQKDGVIPSPPPSAVQ